MPKAERSGSAGPYTTRIAFICTANRARSPFAAALLAQRVGWFPVRVESFGVLGQQGAPALPSAVRVAHEYGIDLSTHHARALPPGVLDGVDLAIGFEPAHLAAATASGAAPDRAFLLTELALVLQYDVLPWPDAAADLGSRVAHANARRFSGERLPTSLDDPVGGPDWLFRQTYDEIERAVAIITLRLFGVSDAPRG